MEPKKNEIQLIPDRYPDEPVGLIVEDLEGGDFFSQDNLKPLFVGRRIVGYRMGDHSGRSMKFVGPGGDSTGLYRGGHGGLPRMLRPGWVRFDKNPLGELPPGRLRVMGIEEDAKSHEKGGIYMIGLILSYPHE